MTYLSVILLFSIFNLSCSTGDQSSCSKDTDCINGRICNYGSCIDPPEPEVRKVCGEVVRACNCDYTSAYPGSLSGNTSCESKVQQYFSCPGSCYGGYPWGTRCYCE